MSGTSCFLLLLVLLLLTTEPPCVSRGQEQELLARISDLQSEVCSRNNRITDLDHEIHSLNETIDTLTRELEHKGKEVLRVRSEANQQIRYGTGPSHGGQIVICNFVLSLFPTFTVFNPG